MSDGARSLTLPQGLARQRSRDLATLVAQVTGHSDGIDDLPALAPALLFADAQVQRHLALPVAGPGEALVQDYQAIRFHRAFPCDTPLQATLAADHRQGGVDYRLGLATSEGLPCATLQTALRLVPARDVGLARPAQFRPEALKNATCDTPVVPTQAQIDRYLALSGDANPIHRDPGAVRAMGLEAPVVPGLMLASLVQPLCAATLPDRQLQGLKARFLAPHCVGFPLRICLQQRGTDAASGMTRARAYVLNQDDRALAISDLTLA